MQELFDRFDHKFCSIDWMKFTSEPNDYFKDPKFPHRLEGIIAHGAVPRFGARFANIIIITVAAEASKHPKACITHRASHSKSRSKKFAGRCQILDRIVFAVVPAMWAAPAVALQPPADNCCRGTVIHAAQPKVLSTKPTIIYANRSTAHSSMTMMWWQWP